MSEALDYLMQARPEAMSHYFAFLKQAGASLDPKTRAIISVLTKVPNRTERGFRQYLRRALAEGASADEILDALLLAFPVIGLAGLVWAVDLLLAMDLPEFRPEALAAAGAQTGEWQALARLEALTPGAQALECAGRRLLVYRAGEAVRCYSSRCPHQGGTVAVGEAGQATARCPRHGWQFDLASGRCTRGGERGLAALATRIEDGEVLVRLPRNES